jgi:ABC-2 type transport system permease protein
VSRLLTVELRRLFARRLVLALMSLALVVTVLAFVGVHLELRSAEANAVQAQEFYEEALAAWEEFGEQDKAECEEAEAQERERTGQAEIDFGCEGMGRPVLEDFLWQPPGVAEQVRIALAGLTVAVATLALLVGGTFTAAEFSTRAIGTWLTFEPRRDRVWAAKVLAAALGVVPVAVLFVVLLLVGIPAVYRLNGVAATLSAAVWGDVLAGAGRAVLLVAVAAAAGAALGMLLRNTAALLGLVVGYVILVEGILRNVLTWLDPFVLSRGMEAWIRGGLTWQTYDCSTLTELGDCREVVRSLSAADAAVQLGVVLLVVLGLSWLRFRRSDIE